MRAALLMLLAVACTNPVPQGAPGASDSQPGTSMQTPSSSNSPRVIFPDGFVVNVEIANDEDLRAQGLMYRDQLRPGTGMLFFFPEAGLHSFWMKNTRIPLDIIWIDADRRIVDIAHDVPPCRTAECPSYPPAGPASYVLEVAGGVARQHALKAGDSLRFEQTEGFVAR